MEIRVLGPLEVRAEASVALGGTKQRAVLAMLALHGNRVVSVNSLLEGLWGQTPPSTADNAVQVYVSRLRKTLRTAAGSDHGVVLLRRKPGYVLECDADTLDLWRFERLAAKACRHCQLQPNEPPRGWVRRSGCGAARP